MFSRTVLVVTTSCLFTLCCGKYYGSTYDRILHSNNLFPNQDLGYSYYEINAETIDGAAHSFEHLLADTLILKKAYHNYLDQFNKVRRPAEIEDRLKIFCGRLMEIFRHNLKAHIGLYTWVMGVNAFSDLTYKEFHYGYLGYRADNITNSLPSVPTAALPKLYDTSPELLDWRDHYGIVTYVKNQKRCRASAQFAGVAALESSHSLWHKTQIYDLSEQELIDCSRFRGNGGCSGGGSFFHTFNYLAEEGLSLAKEYPFEGRDDICRAGGKARYSKALRWWAVSPAGDEQALKDAVANHGPIAATIYVNKDFQNYKGGIYDAPCHTEPNHAVLIVGYQREMDKDYWVVKNSWGMTWGESGFGRVQRNRGNACGIAQEAVLLRAK